MTRPAVPVRFGVRLSDVVARLDREGLLVSSPTADPVLAGIDDDSRVVAPAHLFCAWVGTATDGHGYLPAVEQAGAAAALVERRVPEVEVPQVVVVDGRRAAAAAAALMYGDPADELVMVGVTGTNGKTTTTWILRHLLDGRYRAASIGTLGVLLPEGAVPETDPLTTPGPVALARALRELANQGVTAVAMEVSSHALHQGRVHGVRFDAAVFTNLTRDHLDYHGTEAAYLEAKRSLIGLLRANGTAVINADDAAWAGLEEAAPHAVRFGIRAADAEIRAESLELTARGARFEMVTSGGILAAELPLLGAFNVQNALGAAAACLALGIPADEVVARLATVPQVPGRLERIADWPCPVLTDYAHTPDALERVLATIRPLVAGRLIVVFGAGGDRDRGKRPLMGEVAERYADVAIVTSDNPRTEDPDAIIDEIVAGMPAGRHLRITNRRAAIGKALSLASADDLILLAGKGHETYQILGTERVPFDERQVVAEQVLAMQDGVER
ncbi:MAG TPA: UDP-N-acetylmuramoyl-L-alanyl-D-glutamate--2,6-diaminopimelate ligase [Longimicrobiales bacterium]|nr:UDP-N-acetylmuramoyl-L-alanyl-D-glutamate--2,6-diaminopimelate ligase [Longimicrobiales bacterium]